MVVILYGIDYNECNFSDAVFGNNSGVFNELEKQIQETYFIR